MKNIKIFLYKVLKFIFSFYRIKKYFSFKKDTDYLILENLNELKEISQIGLIILKKKS